MKKTYKIEGMHCNSCERLIENKLKDKVGSVKASFRDEIVDIEFDEDKITEDEIKKGIKELGYEIKSNEENLPKKDEIEPHKESICEKNKSSNTLEKVLLIGVGLFIIYMAYTVFIQSSFKLPEFSIPEIGQNTSLILLFLAGILTGFHCISMCGGFVLSYTTKNAMCGHTSFKQHLAYGGAKVISYSVIGGIFGLIGGIFSFSVGLRGWVAILAGIFMIFYALSMFGVKYFRKFQFNPKFLTKAAAEISTSSNGMYRAPFITGLLNGLFIACGPLQAMYLYAAGTGGFISGATSLAAFGLGTLPIMLGFGSLATTISHKTTSKILKISAIIVLILGLIMLNRGLALTGSSFNYDSIKAKIIGNTDAGSSGSTLNNGYQEINMNVDGSGYSPNSFVIKKGIPVKWNVDVKQLTGCNSELISNEYNINARLKSGLNTFEFTPDKTGTFTFTCGMGMLRGSFIVTETGTASQEQIKAATPAAGGSCGMGGGGGCGCGGGSK